MNAITNNISQEFKSEQIYPQMQVSQNRQYLDYFKLFKIFQLKKIQKHGEVKLTQDKQMARKILAVEGNVSTQNYINFDTATVTLTNPAISFAQKYLYIVACSEPSKNLCFQITLQCNAKINKFLFSTLYKQQKKTSNGIIQMPLVMKPSVWTFIVIDLYDLCQRIKTDKQKRITSKIINIQIRASSRIKNMYQSDYLFDVYTLPKDMELPLKTKQQFYKKYNYCMIGNNNTKEQKLNKQNYSEYSNIQERLQQQKSEYQSNKKPQNDTKDKKHSIQKQKQKYKQKQKQKQKIRNINKVSSVSKINNRNKIKSKNKIGAIQESLYQDFINDDQDTEQMPRTQLNPRPQVTVSAKLMALQGNSMYIDQVVCLEGFIVSPTIFAVHKPIANIKINKDNPFQVALGYRDGSLSIWDIIRQKSLSYIKTDILKIKAIEFSQQQQSSYLYIVGIDSKKRQLIMVLCDNQILYQKVSTFHIGGILLPKTHEPLLVTYGYQNIRIWKHNPQNSILTGISIYLGKMNIKVTYKDCCQISQQLIYAIDSSGYLTQINLVQQKTVQISKISEQQLDHIINIKQLKQILVIDVSGCGKLLDYQLNIQQQFEFGNRIKNICYKRDHNQKIYLKIQNYNKSLAEFDLDSGAYTYLMRSHCDQIIGLKYMEKLGKIVTVSKDNTIRIWQLAQVYNQDQLLSNNQLQWSIKQQYQFVIQTGQSMKCMGTDQQQYAYIAMDNNTIRKIDVINYKIVGEAKLPFINHDQDYQNSNQLIDVTIKQIQVSKNGKTILFVGIIKQNNKVINAVTLLTDSNLSVIMKYDCPSSSGLIHNKQGVCRFNQSYKKFAIIWSYGQVNRIQTFSLNSLESPKTEFYIQQKPLSFRYNKQSISLQIKNNNQHYLQIYNDETANIQKVINIKYTKNTGLSSDLTQNVDYPYMIYSNPKDQIQINILQGNKLQIHQAIDMPEPISNIQLIKNIISNQPTKQSSNKIENLIICSGINSYGLYAVKFDVNNLEQMLNYQQQNQRNTLPISSSRNMQSVNQQLNQFMNKNNSMISTIRKPYSLQAGSLAMSIQQQQNQESLYEKDISFGNMDQQHQQIMQIVQKPKKIEGLYQQPQHMFEQVKHVIYGDYFNQQDSHEQIQYSSNKYRDSSENQGLSLIYGWDTKYPNVSELLWYPENQSVLFYSNFSKSLILHQFRQPIEHKIIHLPIQPNFIIELAAKINGQYINKQSVYLGIGMGNQLKLYDRSLNYYKTLTCKGDKIIDGSISICSNFFIVISKQNTKYYIEIIDLITTNTVSSTYICLQNCCCPKIQVNPMQTCLQFILFTQSNVYFYRLTSILTLQMQQLPKINQLVNDFCGQLTCVQFMKMPIDGEQLILLGSQNGSIIVVDSRAAQILIVCKQVINRCIFNIYYNYSDEMPGAITITTKTNTINYYEFIQENTLSNLILLLQKQPTKKLTIDTELQSHSYVHKISSNQATYGMLCMSKYGILWLMDLPANDTMKIMSCHVPIKNAKLLINAVQPLRNNNGFISAANDGCVKLTSLQNLEQLNQIYKPKRRAKDVIYVQKEFNNIGDILVAAFNSEMYIYSFESIKNWKFLGSVKLESEIVKIRHIPYSNNFIVCCIDRLYLIYVTMKSKLLVQICQICDTISHPLGLQVYGYNLILARQINNIDVWIRKQKRSQNILKQLSLNIHQTKYYMMDSYQCSTVDAYFMIANTKTMTECKQYICCSQERSLIQYRDFQQHTLVKQISLDINHPSSMIVLDCYNMFGIGDQNGYLHIINQNGLVIDKIKVFSDKIEGMKVVNESEKTKINKFGHKILVYGESIGLVNI